MDKQDDGLHVRAPYIEDLVRLCRSLNEAGAKYMVIGGFAVILHGAARTTKDIDFLVDDSAENIRAVKQALSILTDNAIASLDENDVRIHNVVRVADEIMVDLMARACTIDFAQAIREGVEYRTIDNVQIPFPTKETLIRMKDTYRNSDKVDIRFLTDKIEEEKTA